MTPTLFPRANPLRSAFTLVELLIVVTIAAVLIALLIPSLRAAKDQTWRVVCASQLRQMAIATTNYATDHNTCFPPTTWHKRVDLGTSGGLPQIQANRDINSFDAFYDDYLNRKYAVSFCPTQRYYSTAKKYVGPIATHGGTGTEVMLEEGTYFKIGGAYAFNGLGITDPRYSSNGTLGSIIDPADPSPAADTAGYPTQQSIDRALRTRAWINGAYVTNIKSTIVPSQIALFGDYNSLRNTISFHASHMISGTTLAPPVNASINLITGMNEALADGHVLWTNYDKSNINTHWVGNFGGTGAQLIVATDR